MNVRLITSCLGSIKARDELLQHDPPDWLISLHGLEAGHDELVGVPGARQMQLQWIEKIKQSPRPLSAQTS